MRAGHAFTTALEMIANEVSEPVASEFRKLYEEQKFGLPVRDALINLTERVPLVDVKFFVTAVMLQRETGGNLAEILDNLSYVIRERFKIMRQVRVYTAQGRLTMMLLMGMPPIIVITMLSMNPSFIRPLFADPIGHVLLVVGHHVADDWLFRDPEDHSDSGLDSYGSGTGNPDLFLTIALVGLCLRRGRLRAFFGAGLAPARPGLAAAAAARKSRRSRSAWSRRSIRSARRSRFPQLKSHAPARG